MIVEVFHNIAADESDRPLGMLVGYQPYHPVALVARFEVPDDMDLFAACEHAWLLFNVGDQPEFGTPNPVAVEYRARGNRSLSKGDIVSVDGRWYACASFGWHRIDEPAARVGTMYGTIPIVDKESVVKG